MKNYFLIFVFSIFLIPARANAGIVRLLDCFLEGAPIPNAAVYSYQGSLWLITTDLDGNNKRTLLPDLDFERKIITVVDRADMKGVLYRSDQNWRFTFKGDGAWFMSGYAHCQEGLFIP